MMKATDFSPATLRIEGDWQLAGNLLWTPDAGWECTAWPEPLASDEAARCLHLHIGGRLQVEGSVLLLGQAGAPRPTLQVDGPLQARHLLVEHAAADIGGGRCEELAIVAGEGASLHCRQPLAAAHCLIAGAAEVAGPTAAVTLPADAAAVLPDALRCLVAPSLARTTDLLGAVRAGNRVLRSTLAAANAPTYDDWRVRLAADGRQLRLVPLDLLDERLIDTALDNDGDALAYVPPAWLTDERCERVLRRSGRSLRRLPPEAITEARVLIAAPHGIALADVPETLWTPTVLEAVLRANGEEFRHLPEALHSDALVIAALIGGGGKALPEPLLTEANVLAAVQADMRTLQELPGRLVTTAVYETALARYGQHPEWAALEKAHRPPKRINGYEFPRIWLVFLDVAYCVKAARKDAELYAIPRSLITAEVAAAALERDFYNFTWMPQEFMTPELCARAVRHPSAGMLEHIPRHLVTRELCLTSVKVYGSTLQFVPADLIDVDICVAALRERSTAAEFVPPHLAEAAYTRCIALDLAEEADDPDADADGGSFWHYRRAESRRQAGNLPGALADITLGIPHMRYPSDGYFLQACIHRDLGQADAAAVAAACVLARHDTFPESHPELDATWLRPAVAEFAARCSDADWRRLLPQHPLLLSAVPAGPLTPELCRLAVDADPDTVAFVPKALYDAHFYAVAVATGHKEFENIPPPLISEAACIAEVSEYGWRLERIPEEWRTEAVCHAAVAASSQAWPHVPAALREKLGYVAEP